MRKTVSFLAAVIFLTGIYMILLKSFPVYAYLLPFVVTLVVLDGYLWTSIRKRIAPLKSWRHLLVAGLYWSPLILLILFIISGIFITFINWNIFLRTYLMAVIAIIYVCKVFPILFLLFADIVRILRFSYLLLITRQRTKFSLLHRIKGLLFTGWITGTLFFLLFLYGMIFGMYDFRVREVAVKLPELPSSFDGLRIVQVSDIHLGSWSCKRKLAEAVDRINSLHPDIVFFTGDLVNYSSYEAYEFAGILAKIKANSGIFSILGNHDYGDYVSWPSPEAKRKNMLYLYDIYKFLGWKLLLNENVLIRRGNDSIAIIGVQNWGMSKRFQRLGNLDTAMKGVSTVAVQLLLSHDPSHWDKVVRKDFRNIDITFSGHTHGFQFGIDCCGILWSPSEYIYPQWGNLYSSPVQGSHPQYLYVNRGLGSIGYPGRIGILPEITLMVLRRN